MIYLYWTLGIVGFFILFPPVIITFIGLLWGSMGIWGRYADWMIKNTLDR